jgi:hypothetical protein
MHARHHTTSVTRAEFCGRSRLCSYHLPHFIWKTSREFSDMGTMADTIHSIVYSSRIIRSTLTWSTSTIGSMTMGFTRSNSNSITIEYQRPWASNDMTHVTQTTSITDISIPGKLWHSGCRQISIMIDTIHNTSGLVGRSRNRFAWWRNHISDGKNHAFHIPVATQSLASHTTGLKGRSSGRLLRLP